MYRFRGLVIADASFDADVFSLSFTNGVRLRATLASHESMECSHSLDWLRSKTVISIGINVLNYDSDVCEVYTEQGAFVISGLYGAAVESTGLMVFIPEDSEPLGVGYSLCSGASLN